MLAWWVLLFVGASIAEALPQQLSQTTAFRALFEAGKQAPGASLVSISGENGEPQPASWLFLYADSAARGGAREVVIRGTALESVRTPLKGHAGIAQRPVVSLDRLAVDSDRAFSLANNAAIRARVGFNAINYRLEAAADGEPFWTLELLPAKGGKPLGRVQVSAVTGDVQSSGLFSASSEASTMERIEQDAVFLLEGFAQEISGFFERLGRTVRSTLGRWPAEDDGR